MNCYGRHSQRNRHGDRGRADRLLPSIRTIACDASLAEGTEMTTTLTPSTARRPPLYVNLLNALEDGGDDV